MPDKALPKDTPMASMERANPRNMDCLFVRELFSELLFFAIEFLIMLIVIPRNFIVLFNITLGQVDMFFSTSYESLDLRVVIACNINHVPIRNNIALPIMSDKAGESILLTAFPAYNEEHAHMNEIIDIIILDLRCMGFF